MGDFLHRTTRQLYISTSPNQLAEVVGNYIEDPDLVAVEGVPSKYWIITGDIVTEMTQVEKDAIDSAELEGSRDSNIQAQIDDLESVFRQFVIMTTSEINILRGWIVDYKVEVAAASNLGNLQARVAALPDLLDRAFAQIKTQLRDALGS